MDEQREYLPSNESGSWIGKGTTANGRGTEAKRPRGGVIKREGDCAESGTEPLKRTENGKPRREVQHNNPQLKCNTNIEIHEYRISLNYSHRITRAPPVLCPFYTTVTSLSIYAFPLPAFSPNIQ